MRAATALYSSRAAPLTALGQQVGVGAPDALGAPGDDGPVAVGPRVHPGAQPVDIHKAGQPAHAAHGRQQEQEPEGGANGVLVGVQRLRQGAQHRPQGLLQVGCQHGSGLLETQTGKV